MTYRVYVIENPEGRYDIGLSEDPSLHLEQLRKRMTRTVRTAKMPGMRKIPGILLALLAISLPAMAEDWKKKDPEALANEARKMSENLRKEVEYFEAKAIKEGRTLSSDEEKYLTYTREEADQLQKSCEAWEKNQKRMAEKFREKAGEFCHKRGEMASKLKLWDDKCAPPADGKKKESDTAAKLAEIEKQQAELDRKKKELQEAE